MSAIKILRNLCRISFNSELWSANSELIPSSQEQITVRGYIYADRALDEIVYLVLGGVRRQDGGRNLTHAKMQRDVSRLTTF